MIKDISFPKISIVTPNLNGEAFLEETILSVLGQNYPNLEYIVIDGGSTDRSVEIIKKYEDCLTYWISEPDNGLYDALQKGFEKSTGEIMTWINSDDILHVHSFKTVNETFEKYYFIHWITGLCSQIDENGRNIGANNILKWSRLDYLMGNYKFIQQEGTFWKRDLWEKAGSYIDKSFKLAGDYDLWNRFFLFEKLYSINSILASFRVRKTNQLSLDMIQYHTEVERSFISRLCDNDHIVLKIIKLKNKRERLLKIPILWRILQPFVERKTLKYEKEMLIYIQQPCILKYNKHNDSFEISD